MKVNKKTIKIHKERKEEKRKKYMRKGRRK